MKTKQKKQTFDCCVCKKHCGESPKIWVIMGIGVSTHAWFCSLECFYKWVDNQRGNNGIQ